MTTKSLDKRVRLSHLTTAKVIKALLEGSSTAHDLAEASGLHIITVYEFMRAMRKLRVAHICGWDQDSLGRDAIAVFAIGPGKDVRRRAMSRAQISRRYRDRLAIRGMTLAIVGQQEADKNF